METADSMLNNCAIYYLGINIYLNVLVVEMQKKK